jgi:hypothetical protein
MFRRQPLCLSSSKTQEQKPTLKGSLVEACLFQYAWIFTDKQKYLSVDSKGF